VADRAKISLEPLLERARSLRRDAARLMGQLGKTSDEIAALTKGLESKEKKPGRPMQPKRDKPR
jgi:hypothetical protein